MTSSFKGICGQNSNDGNKEYYLFVASSGEIRLILGGTNNTLYTDTDHGGMSITGKFSVFVNILASTYSIKINDVEVKTGSVTVGAGRTDGMPWITNARANSSDPGSTATTHTSTFKIGDYRIKLNGNVVQRIEFSESVNFDDNTVAYYNS